MGYTKKDIGLNVAGYKALGLIPPFLSQPYPLPGQSCPTLYALNPWEFLWARAAPSTLGGVGVVT